MKFLAFLSFLTSAHVSKLSFSSSSQISAFCGLSSDSTHCDSCTSHFGSCTRQVQSTMPPPSLTCGMTRRKTFQPECDARQNKNTFYTLHNPYQSISVNQCQLRTIINVDQYQSKITKISIEMIKSPALSIFISI